MVHGAELEWKLNHIDCIDQYDNGDKNCDKCEHQENQSSDAGAESPFRVPPCIICASKRVGLASLNKIIHY